MLDIVTVDDDLTYIFAYSRKPTRKIFLAESFFSNTIELLTNIRTRFKMASHLHVCYELLGSNLHKTVTPV